MDIVCKNHSSKKAISFCHNCGDYFCEECLNEGENYYYCNNSDCIEIFLKETKNITKKIKIYASFSYRLVAFLIDSAVLFVITSIIFTLYFLSRWKNKT